MEYKTLRVEELMEIINEYTNRLEKLQEMIAQYLRPTMESTMQAVNIHEEYKQIKDEIREIAHYVGLSRNARGSSVYSTVFRPAFREASAYGMTVSTGASISGKMLSAVEEAHYRLRKYMYVAGIDIDE